MNKNIVLIDGNSLMFRAYYATSYTGNLMQTSTGLYTNALYGFANMLQKIQDTFDCTYMLVAFDKGKNTFRHKALATYKGTRKHMPEELAMQLPIIREYLDVLGIKRLELDEYEADDIVGSMAKFAKNQGFNVVCLSGDRDLLQLTSQNVTVMLTRKGITELDEYNVLNFKEKMGFDPEQMVDYKAIIGDTSDNLEGVKGVGPKTAVSLLEKYQTLDGIYEHVNELTPRCRDSFIEARETSAQTKFLATIYQDIDFDFTIEDCKTNEPNNNLLRAFYEKCEFTSFIKKMKITTVVEETIDVKKHFDDIEGLSSALKDAKECFFDIELDGDNYHKANILGFSFIVNNNAYFVDKGIFLNSDLKDYLENSQLIKFCLDSKKCYVALKYLGINLTGVLYDCSLAIYLVNPNYIAGDIKTTLEHFITPNMQYLEEVYGKKATYQIPFYETYANYALDKLIGVMVSKKEILKQIHELELDDLFDKVELPLAFVLGDIEFNGFKIDVNHLDEIGLMLNDKIKEIEQRAYAMLGKEFNLASPKQLGVILFEELKVGKGKKNKTGYSTSAEVLESLKDEHPLIPLILDYRKYAKLYTTYVVGLKQEIAKDGKVHTTFKQTLTSTGRLSSTEPNIQNIPTRDEEGKIIRSAFVPSTKDGVLISADYSQIELRLLAEMSGCSEMINDFNHGLDLHTSTAAKINNVTYEEVTKDMRRMAKTVNFGIVYGMSDWGLADTLHIQPIEAAIFIEKYFDIYPEIKAYLDKIVIDATNCGYTKTLYGRRRYIPELSSPNHALKMFGERTSKNAPIQGTAADVIKMAMVKVSARMKEENLKSLMVAQVHDELIIDTVVDEIEIVKNILKEEMENVVKLKVQLIVDVETGNNWDMK